MKLQLIAALLLTSVAAQSAIANTTTIQVQGIQSYYPQSDNIVLTFDDGLGATAAPYWLNGFVPGSATTGYTGTITSTFFGYSAPVYIAFNTINQFYIFQECSPSTKCYLALSTATNGVPTTIDPRSPGNLATYLHENLDNLTSFAGPNAGWNVSYNSLPSFPESFPWLQVVKPDNIHVSSVPEQATSFMYIFGLLTMLGFNSMRRRSAGA